MAECQASPAGPGDRENDLSNSDAANPVREDGLDAGHRDTYDPSCASDKGLGASDGRVGLEQDSLIPSDGGRDGELTRQLPGPHGPRLDGERTRQLPSQGGLSRGLGGEGRGGVERGGYTSSRRRYRRHNGIRYRRPSRR